MSKARLTTSLTDENATEKGDVSERRGHKRSFPFVSTTSPHDTNRCRSTPTGSYCRPPRAASFVPTVNVVGLAQYLSDTLNPYQLMSEIQSSPIMEKRGAFFRHGPLVIPDSLVKKGYSQAQQFQLHSRETRDLVIALAIQRNEFSGVASYCAAGRTTKLAAMVWSRIRALIDVPWPWVPVFRIGRIDIREAVRDLYGVLVARSHASFSRIQAVGIRCLHSGPWEIPEYSHAAQIQILCRQLAAPVDRVGVGAEERATMALCGRIHLKLTERDAAALALLLLFDYYEEIGSAIDQIRKGVALLQTSTDSLPA